MNGIALGFIGLGQMGGPMAANIARGGFELSVFDRAGTAERAPEGTTAAAPVAAVPARPPSRFPPPPHRPVRSAAAAPIPPARARQAYQGGQAPLVLRVAGKAFGTGRLLPIVHRSGWGV